MTENNGAPLPRIAAVTPLDGLVLLVQWPDGRAVAVSLAAWIADGGTLLAAIGEPETFKTAKVVDYGTGIQWGGDDNLHIDAYHLTLLA